MVKLKNLLKQKQHLLIPKAHMRLLSYTPIGLLKIIERPMESMHVMEFFLIMKAQGEAKLLLPER